MDYKLESLRKLLGVMKKRSKKKDTSAYKNGAEMSGMAGYLPDMGQDYNMSARRKQINNAKPYDRIEKKAPK
jgi:hypothetical protein